MLALSRRCDTVSNSSSPVTCSERAQGGRGRTLEALSRRCDTGSNSSPPRTCSERAQQGKRRRGRTHEAAGKEKEGAYS
eukprot:351938-Chlamydomonas_euryale.AAC.10